MDKIGQANGLVWTPQGSSLIQIKVKIRKGTGKLSVDGDIGHDFLLAIEDSINLFQSAGTFDLEKVNITFCIPTPIDGASAGLTLFVAISSAITKQPVNQRMAFTGALGEEGAVLPVDEIADKILAAHRANCEAIVFPVGNMPDLPQRNWGNLALCPILRVTEAIVVSVPSILKSTKLKG